MDSEKESPDYYLSGNKSPALVFTYAAPSPVTHHVAPTPTTIEFETPARFTCPPAPVIEHVSATLDDTSASRARIDSHL